MALDVGFFRGAELPDPSGLLEGDGKLVRHVKLTRGAEGRGIAELPILPSEADHIVRASARDR